MGRAARKNKMMSLAVQCSLLVVLGCSGDSNIFGTDVSDQDTVMIHESLLQSPSAAYDILWVVDNTTSMLEVQSFLSTEVSEFYENLNLLPVDYQLGVISTELSEDSGGLLLGQPWIVTSDTLEGKAAFESNFAVGNGATTANQGLSAMRTALSLPRVDGSNRGFLRNNANLQVYFVSDGDDDSADVESGFVLSVSVFTEFLLGLKADDQNRVHVHSIVGSPSNGGCRNDEFPATSADRYGKIAEDTGGQIISICAPDGEIAQPYLNVPKLLRVFALSETPLEGSLQLYLNEEEIPRDAWRLVDDQVEILDSSYLPNYDGLIEARYLARAIEASP